MRTEFHLRGTERKPLIDAIADCLNEKAEYLRTPSYAYRIGDFTVTRDGALEFDDRTDSETVEAVYDAIAAAGIAIPEADTAATVQNEAAEGIGAPAEDGADTAAQEAAETQPAADTAATAQGDTAEETDAAAEDSADTAAQEGCTVALPMRGHTGISLRNFISMIYSRGSLISKATGGRFEASEGLVEELKNDSCCLTPERLMKTVADFERAHGTALTGLTFDDEKVSFTGFPATDDTEKLQAFQMLACRMNKLAKEQKRTLARRTDDANEKYSFRIWLVRLGMAGSEFKAARKVLLAPLSGSAAFKDAAMEQRWQENRKAEREAAKEAENNEVSE